MKIQKNNQIIVENVKLSNTFLKRGIGLLLHKNLEENSGMLFTKVMQIHTFFMRFAIDVVFCNSDGEIIEIYDSLKPFRMTKIHFKSEYVLELASGVANKKGLKIGDKLGFFN